MCKVLFRLDICCTVVIKYSKAMFFADINFASAIICVLGGLYLAVVNDNTRHPATNYRIYAPKMPAYMTF